jgi:hypothetical protein
MRHCCDVMRQEVERHCEQHPDRYDCPDCLIQYSPKLREYGLIIHDGGRSTTLITFCPWCGAKLPESLRDRWFAELEQLGLDPAQEQVPEAYRSSLWWEGAESRPGAS